MSAAASEGPIAAGTPVPDFTLQREDGSEFTRADLEGIRGVQSAEVLGQLIEKGLVRITGRDDSLGRPMLYGTTKKFLQIYGLKSLRDLPRATELTGPANRPTNDGGPGS